MASASNGTASAGRKALAVLSAFLLGSAGIAVGSVVLVGLFAIALLTDTDVTTSLQLVLSLAALQGVGFGLVSLSYIWSRPTLAAAFERLGVNVATDRLQVEARVPSLREGAIVVGGWIGAFVTALAFAAGLQAVLQRLLDESEPAANQAAEAGMEQPELLLLLIPVSILLIGPAEELLFRGVVQGRLREVFGAATSILLASVFFAGIHFPALVGGSTAGNVARLSVLLVPSVVVGTAYEYTDNIVVPSLIHGLYNATFFGLLYLAVSTLDGDEFQSAGATLASVAAVA